MKPSIHIPNRILRETKRIFSRLRHTRMTLPVLSHVLLRADETGVRLMVSDLDHWLETTVSNDGHEPVSFLIPPDAMDVACRADRGSIVSFTPRGSRKAGTIRLVVTQGGIEASSVHPTLDAKEFPEIPSIEGACVTLPPDTLRNLDSVAGCASKDITRHILNGVFFTPVEGGRLVATDGKRLAICPAETPPHAFVLPMGPVSVLRHHGFSSDLCEFTWIDCDDPDKRRVAFRCGAHLLVATTLAGRYPDYQQVIPRDANQLAVVSHDRRPGVIAWLRGLKAAGQRDPSVRLDWKKRGTSQNGTLRLGHCDGEGRSSTLEVPVEIHGSPPSIAFHPEYLADALEIGGTICLNDEISPGICRHPSGRFCVLMPMRLSAPAANSNVEAGQSQAA